MGWQLFTDVTSAADEAKRDASRELGVTLTISLGTFVIAPLIYIILLFPNRGGIASLFEGFTNADIYIAAVSLLSISVYSISKEYKSDHRDRFGFPHATTIICFSVAVLIISSAAYTARLINTTIDGFTWQKLPAAIIGWGLFFITCLLSYGVLVLKNELETGAARRTRQDEEDFVNAFLEEN